MIFKSKLFAVTSLFVSGGKMEIGTFKVIVLSFFIALSINTNAVAQEGAIKVLEGNTKDIAKLQEQLAEMQKQYDLLVQKLSQVTTRAEKSEKNIDDLATSNSCSLHRVTPAGHIRPGQPGYEGTKKFEAYCPSGYYVKGIQMKLWTATSASYDHQVQCCKLAN